MNPCGHVIAGSRNIAGCGPSTKLTSLPSLVAICLVEVEVSSILIFNVRRRIRTIILLQSVTKQFRRLFWHISYYKVRQSTFITKCDRLLLQSALGITKCDSYYKLRGNRVCNSLKMMGGEGYWNCLNFHNRKIQIKDKRLT